jgi:hypothetical protein
MAGLLCASTLGGHLGHCAGKLTLICLALT